MKNSAHNLVIEAKERMIVKQCDTTALSNWQKRKNWSQPWIAVPNRPTLSLDTPIIFQTENAAAINNWHKVFSEAFNYTGIACYESHNELIWCAEAYTTWICCWMVSLKADDTNKETLTLNTRFQRSVKDNELQNGDGLTSVTPTECCRSTPWSE